MICTRVCSCFTVREANHSKLSIYDQIIHINCSYMDRLPGKVSVTTRTLINIHWLECGHTNTSILSCWQYQNICGLSGSEKPIFTRLRSDCYLISKAVYMPKRNKEYEVEPLSPDNIFYFNQRDWKPGERNVTLKSFDFSNHFIFSSVFHFSLRKLLIHHM